MAVRDSLVKAGEKLAHEIGASAIIIISPQGSEIKRMLDTTMPVIIARLGEKPPS